MTWDDPNANVKIFLRDENNAQIANDMDGGSPAMVPATAQTSGTWSIGVDGWIGRTDTTTSPLTITLTLHHQRQRRPTSITTIIWARPRQ